MPSINRRQFLFGSAALAANSVLATQALALESTQFPLPEDQVLAPPTNPIAPRSLLARPIKYGYQDVSIPGTSLGTRRARIYFPSTGSNPATAPIQSGRYSLVMFCHGQRDSGTGLCPADIANDHRRWGRLVSLWARCGFIVVVPQMEFWGAGAYLLEDIHEWLHTASAYRDYLMRPAAGTIADGPEYQDLALIGHSWAAFEIGTALTRGRLRPRCVGLANGAWDSNEAISGLRSAGIPSLLVAASGDEVSAALPSSASGVYTGCVSPKYQAVIQNASHWTYSDIGYCSRPPFEIPPPHPGHAAIASELFVVFLHKYLYRRYELTPSLSIPTDGRPSLAGYFAATSSLALRVRWDESFSNSVGQLTRGSWTVGDPW